MKPQNFNIYSQIKIQVWNQVENQIKIPLENHVKYKVWEQVENKLWCLVSIRDQVWCLVRNQIENFNGTVYYPKRFYFLEN